MEFKPLIGITYEFIFQLVNTFLVFFLLKKLLFKPVLGIIEAREKDIREDLAQGERAKKEGLSLKSEYEEKLNSAKEQGQEIIKQATLRAEQKETEIKTEDNKLWQEILSNETSAEEKDYQDNVLILMKAEDCTPEQLQAVLDKYGLTVLEEGQVIPFCAVQLPEHLTEAELEALAEKIGAEDGMVSAMLSYIVQLD